MREMAQKIPFLQAILAMSGLPGGEQDLARQWAAQSVNTFGQFCFAVGVYFLSRSAVRPKGYKYDDKNKAPGSN
jgi:hypothetical protein